MKKSTCFSKLFILMLIFCGTAIISHASIVTGTLGNFEGSYGIDFNNDGTAEFYIRDAGFEVTHTNAMLMFAWSENGNNIWTNGTLDAGGWDDVKPLTAGTSIGSNGNWEAQGDAYLVNYYDETLFPSDADSYIGFRIKINGNTHYGWAKVHVSGTVSTGLQIQWLQCAYESTPNTPIVAGSTGTGIRDNELPMVTAYPNPVVNEVTITASVENAASVNIYDMNGRLVNTPVFTDTDQIRINFEDCTAGIYFVRFNSNTVKVVKK